jgi:hypothetical protein
MSGAPSAPVTNETADNHFGFVRWDEATLPSVAVITQSGDKTEKVETPEAILRRTLKISEWNPGLTLLYFHTPHEDLTKDKLVGAAMASLKQCKTFSNDKVIRWLSLYHPVEVDMGKSDLKSAERLGFKDGAIFSIIDQDLNVLATAKPSVESAAVESFLKTTLKSDKAAKHWAMVQTQIDEQKKALDSARALAAQKKWKEASAQYDLALNSNIRVAEWYDEAAKEAEKARRKADQQDK